MENKKEKEQQAVEREVFIQYRHYENTLDEIEKRIKESYFRKEVEPIRTLQIYIKPEDSAAYYVINERYDGKVQLF